jgi:hypothetical protein
MLCMYSAPSNATKFYNNLNEMVSLVTTVASETGKH